jgi:hypothetical protein
MRFLVAVFLVWSACANAQTSDCKTIVDTVERLSCFDKSGQKALPLRDKISQTAISILDSPAASAAIFAALLALIGGVLGPLVQLKIGKKQAAVAKSAAAASQTAANASMQTAKNAGNREIARLRMNWIEKVRDVLAEYHAILMSVETEDGETKRKLLQLGTQLDLLLNQNDPPQKLLWDIADRIFKTRDIETRKKMDPELISAGRAVFDGEWKKIKAEMKGEDFKMND